MINKLFFYLAYLPIRFYGRAAKPKDALVFMLSIHKRLLTLISDRASDYEGGVHPKHRLMQYHLFFTERMIPNEKVLDIGSGRGFLSFKMAEAGALVTGIELSQKNVDTSKKLYLHKNLNFFQGDAWIDLPEEKFDTAVMSNVLEHIDNRVEFLKMVQAKNNPDRWLIRVPCFDRDWIVPMAKELGIDSRLDETHFTEFTIKSFEKEMTEAGLKPIHTQVVWGEIWSELKPL